MSDEIEISITVSTDKVGSECKDSLIVDREDWENMSDDEKDEECKETAFQMIDWSYEEIKQD